MNTLYGFGMAIGWMDIIGAILFEVTIIFLMRRRNSKETKGKLAEAAVAASASKRRTLPSSLYRTSLLEDGANNWLFWIYLILLNAWILITMLMVLGILQLKSRYMIVWLVWCVCGLLFDLFFVFWWLIELLIGDAIEAWTNILISMLTMAIEFGFIYIIFSIYLDILSHEYEAKKKEKRFSFWNLLVPHAPFGLL